MASCVDFATSLLNKKVLIGRNSRYRATIAYSCNTSTLFGVHSIKPDNNIFENKIIIIKQFLNQNSKTVNVFQNKTIFIAIFVKIFLTLIDGNQIKLSVK